MANQLICLPVTSFTMSRDSNVDYVHVIFFLSSCVNSNIGKHVTNIFMLVTQKLQNKDTGTGQLIKIYLSKVLIR